MRNSKSINKELDSQIEANINNFIIRCFRDVADHDYIVARLCYRYNLAGNFYWQALQSIEKYLKAILLFEREDTRKHNHNIVQSFEEVKKLSYNFDFTKIESMSNKYSVNMDEFIAQIYHYGNNRYFEKSYSLYGEQLSKLDCAVWMLRRYCQPLKQKTFSGKPIPVEKIMSSIHAPLYDEYPYKYRLIGGVLEQIVDGYRCHFDRNALIWCNQFYGSRKNYFLPPERFVTNKAPFEILGNRAKEISNSEEKSALNKESNQRNRIIFEEVFERLNKMVKISREMREEIKSQIQAQD